MEQIKIRLQVEELSRRHKRTVRTTLRLIFTDELLKEFSYKEQQKEKGVLSLGHSFFYITYSFILNFFSKFILNFYPIILT